MKGETAPCNRPKRGVGLYDCDQCERRWMIEQEDRLPHLSRLSACSTVFALHLGFWKHRNERRMYKNPHRGGGSEKVESGRTDESLPEFIKSQRPISTRRFCAVSSLQLRSG